jgi:uncharacterized membrane protein (UPF0127 family)
MILNKTKDCILANKVQTADTPVKRMVGLLGRKSLSQGEALIIKPCNSVHTFFMRFPIDVLFVDKNNLVVKTINNIVPFRISPISFRSKFVIELPVGTIQATKTFPGDQLIIN